MDDSFNLTTAMAKQTVELVLGYEVCFVRKDVKVGWGDQATHSVDTGDNRPVKP